MISSNCEPFPPPEYSVKEKPFPPPEYSVKEEPFIDYTFSPWTHPQGFDHSIVSPLQCNHHVQPSCVSPSCWPPFPTNHNPMKAISHDVNNKDNGGSDMLEVAIHQKFMSLVVDISIFWLQEKISWTRLHPFLTSSHIIIHLWASYFPTSRLQHPPCAWVCIRFGIFCMSNHRSRHIYIDLMICWLHWLYDYT